MLWPSARDAERNRRENDRADYRIEGRDRFKMMTLHSHEPLRRFLIHVLRRGFHRIHHYGLSPAPRVPTTSPALANSSPYLSRATIPRMTAGAMPVSHKNAHPSLPL